MTDPAPAPHPTPTATPALAAELRTLVNRLAHHLRTPGLRHGITPTRLAALAALSRHGPVRAGDLASTLGITPASTTRLVDVLVESGWVGRSRDPGDQRASLLALTDAGTARLEALRTEGAATLAHEIERLSTEERAALADALPVLRLLADRYLDAPAHPAAHPRGALR